MRREMGLRALLVSSLVVLLAWHSITASPFARAEVEADVAASGDFPKVEESASVVPPASTTDTQTQDREKESMRRQGEKFAFQAEVSRLMDIIINSLYSNKDIFLRELISNASDALDKIRFLALTDKTVLGEGDEAKLEIQITLDKENKILTLRDRGVGMTKEELIKNLGTIAKSGTSAFLETMQTGGDLNLIGQFGVGFYSVYLVADYVEVHSKSNDDIQWVWASKADGNFDVYEDLDGAPLGRGTEIRIHLKEEAKEYSNEDKLKELVKKYSQFINFPISLWASKEVDVEVPADDDEEVEEEVEETETAEGEEETTEEETSEETEDEESEAPKTKTVKETKWDWELLNDVKAVWLRNPKEVTEEEYLSFYKGIAKDFGSDKPLSWSHFNAEGDVEFKAILYIPPKAASDMYDNYYSNRANLKLYVRRVFISDDFEELLPKYLNFLKGIVDSDTLPLNVSREMLQQHGSLKTIKKKLVRKALDMIRRIAEEDEDDTKKESDTEKEDDADEAGASDKKGKYAKFWNEYGKALKLGVIEDSSNRIRLAKLLRFQSSKSDGKLTSLEEYVSRMKEGQKQIYYLTGQSKEQLEKSPFLEKLLKNDYEVLFLTDAVDEYLMQNLTEFDDKKFQNASKDDLKMANRDKAKDKAMKDEFKDLIKWWKDTLGGDDVEAVKISVRLAETPCIVVTSKYGWSANMERIMQAQALSDTSKTSYMKGRKTLEINPKHPLIKQLKELVAADVEDPKAKEVAKILYDTALLESGFVLEDPTVFANRVYGTLSASLGVDPEAKVDEEEDEIEMDAAEKPEYGDVDAEVGGEPIDLGTMSGSTEAGVFEGEDPSAEEEEAASEEPSSEELKDEL
eukprot:TRINITY_DN32544_c0_g1_i1.p1 TRINITY_DN32544_c0_g1~~TRINITY_DN32544_c0_g1_i1.p1  ORF type:complete len:859 (-),score=258.80 TRINITY_DN32544_c0_g1_i1:582-3158(-)